jgi:hypothetical protein
MRYGRICFKGHNLNLSAVCAGQNIGIKQIAEHVWLVCDRNAPRQMWWAR